MKNAGLLRWHKMEDNENKVLTDVDGLPQPSSQDLRGRQSVRATFKLSTRAIEAMSIVSVHLGIKQKSLFDHLIEDVQSLSQIAREIESEKFRTLSRIQKTFVISRRTLSSLDEISKQFQAPRDALVEYSIQRLLPVIDQERERHLRRKKILSDMDEHLANGLKILRRSESLLGEDDPVFIRLAAAIKAMANAQSNVNAFVEKGGIIEDFR
jgi:hypothetical protein